MIAHEWIPGVQSGAANYRGKQNGGNPMARDPRTISKDSSPHPEPAACDADSLDRRQFVKLAGAGAASLSIAGSTVRPTTASAEDTIAENAVADDHFVPIEKDLSEEWIRTLYAKGEPTVYRGDDLKTIAMPVGGICAGQVYLSGDGRLTHWDIFNQRNFTGYGRDNYALGREPQSPLAQGFAVQAATGGKKLTRTLDAEGFPGVTFCGEYPLGTVEYEADDFPVAVTLEAFSPFVPLSAPDSALPVVVMQFAVKNTSQRKVDAVLAGWLENAVAHTSGQGMYGERVNRVVSEDGLTIVYGSARAVEPPENVRPSRLLADFEGDDYGDWTVEGEAFGKGPARGTLDRQQDVSGFAGRGLVNTYLGGDDQMHGKLVSPELEIDRAFLSFLVGGGDHKDKTCINLLIDDKVVRTAIGKKEEKLLAHNWDVREFAGRKARIEIVDRESGPWGHINIDQIELRDTPMSLPPGVLEKQPDFGTMGLALLESGPSVVARAALPEDAQAEALLQALGETSDADTAERPFGTKLCGALGQRLSLSPGEEARVAFVVAWCFPNRPERGNFYATRFDDAKAVAQYVADHFDRLAVDTRRWHDTWYDSTLPHWLLDRLFSTVSTLATSTCQWWANGRFWAWEGVGCCHGTCAHVWNYEHSMARLFPRLERSVREMQDFNPESGFTEETGAVRFRGEGWGIWAGDSQGGTVLKALREHQMSTDNGFLKENWPRIRKSMEFLIGEDGNADGLIEGSQHNTYDINFFGPNPMIGSLYLAALRAGEEMARELGEEAFATECREIFEAGRKLSVERLFGGEYFVQIVDLEKHPKHQHGDGCLADQLFGQGWAHQVGLGYVYPKQNIDTTLESIWKYNWAPDIGPQNEVHKPERWFASPGEAGLFTCTWPKSPNLPGGVRYKNEVWTGIEYQVAGNMAWDGMVTEALAICRGVHERYHPSKHNPWNEIECGDHYARGMASHGVFLGLCGWEYHGPRGYLGFAPRITPEAFRAAFTAAAGWGTIVQERNETVQTNRIEVKWGTVQVKTLTFELPTDTKLRSAQVELQRTDGTVPRKRPVVAEAKQEERRVEITLSGPIVLEKGQVLEVRMMI